MRRFVRSGLFVLGLSVLVVGLSATNASAQVLREILSRMDTNNKTLQSLTSDVTMVKFNPQLNVSDTTTGKTSYLPKTAKRPMYARIDWVKPVEEQIAVIGDNYELYRPRLNQVIVGNSKSAKNSAAAGGALSFISMSRDQLNANFEVVYLSQEQISGGTETWHLQLTPKTAASYKSAELWVDKDGMPRQAKIIETNNDTTTVLLTKIQKNVTLQASIFKLTYPSSVKKIKA